jgi:regulator of protease activity HflC (stomatin/prohibitin superfamily)
MRKTSTEREGGRRLRRRFALEAFAQSRPSEGWGHERRIRRPRAGAVMVAVSPAGTVVLAVIGVIVLALVVLALLSIRVVRPTHRGLVERLGKYHHYCGPGLHTVWPGIDRLYRIDIREVLVEAQPQEIITNDNLNAKVDAQVYLKVKDDEESVKATQYNVTNYQNQVVNLARTTLRNIIGTLSLKSANSERGKINDELRSNLLVETANWGIEILRTELKEIDPPRDVQETMNKVVKAENEKVAAIDFATATETQADGARRAEIKKAEGIRQAKILQAEGEAQAIQLVNEAADKYFVGNAQMLRKLEAVERALYQNSKVVVPSDTQLVNVIGDLAGLEAQASDSSAPSVIKPLAASPTRRGNGAGSSAPSHS